jgi:hypothetical protein
VFERRLENGEDPAGIGHDHTLATPAGILASIR